MRRAITLVILRALLLVILTASAALLYDYTRPLPAFCEAGAGCDAVRASSFAYILGIPQPAFGLLAYLVVFGITLAGHERRAKLLFPVAVLGAVMGVAFLAIQAFVIGRFCSLCVVVDVASVLVAVVAWLHRKAPGHDGGVPRFAWSLLGACAVVVPLIFGAARPEPPVPAAVARFWVPDKLTIVEMSDFECPYCRILHPSLKEALEPYGDKVQLVRLSVPLSSHPRARDAARAYACAKKLGRGEQMAHALFTSEDLSEQGCRAAADRAGLPQDAFRACFESEQSEKLMMRDVELAKAITFRGLPTLWIGTKSFIGARNVEDLREAIDEQLAGDDAKTASLPQHWMWILLSVVLAVTVAVALKREPRAGASTG